MSRNNMKPMVGICKVLVSTFIVMMLVYHNSQVSCRLTYEALPTVLKECFHELYNVRAVKDSAESIATTCVFNYVWKHVAKRCYDISPTSLEYIGSMLLPYYRNEGNRHKRSMPRKRKEYRSLTTSERQLFHTALQELKNDTFNDTNRYDEIARYHNIAVGSAAHAGSAFLPWHRIYLLIMENALRSKQPDVTIPYWDTTLDSNLDESETSIMWTSDFMGSMDTGWWSSDVVQDGPVQNWNIHRHLGMDGGERINDAHVAELLALQNSTEFASRIEQVHNQAHVWVGGNMTFLESAPFDPIFFMLHGFIDYLWWQWQDNNRNSSFIWEYPLNNGGPHAADQFVMNLQINGNNVTNGDVFNETWAFNYVQYEPRPSCASGVQTCSGSNMHCVDNRCTTASSSSNSRKKRDTTLVRRHHDRRYRKHRTRGRGKSGGRGNKRSRKRRESRISKSRRKIQNLKMSKRNNYWGKQNIDVKILGPIPPLKKKSGKIPQINDYINEDTSKTAYEHKISMKKGKSFSIMNNFEIDCEADINLWVYMPFKVVHLRPDGSVYNSHFVHKGRITSKRDIYDEHMYKSLKSCVKPENPVSHEKCKSDKSGFSKVFIASHGLNYHGTYKDYVILDNRQAIDGKVGYIAFKRPMDKPSKFILTAFDECGRICTPKCRIPGTNPPKYKSCSGVLNVDSKSPRHYSDTYGEAVLRYWNFRNGMCPTAQEMNIDIVFYCEYKNNWFPWYK